MGTLASPMGGRVGSGRGTGRRATQGSPLFLPATPAPTRRIRFPARFTKYLPLGVGLCGVWTQPHSGNDEGSVALATERLGWYYGKYQKNALQCLTDRQHNIFCDMKWEYPLDSHSVPITHQREEFNGWRMFI